MGGHDPALPVKALYDPATAKALLDRFGYDKRDADGFELNVDEMAQKAREVLQLGITELHIVGGLHPELTLDWYCQMLRGLKQRFPQVHLKAFTMVEISYFAQRTKLPTLEVLKRLKEAGMDSMPGGGAEIFSDRVRRIICDHKIDGNDWLRIGGLKGYVDGSLGSHTAA